MPASVEKMTKPDKDLVKYLALAHDMGREGEGADLWDPDSAEKFRIYLHNKGVPSELAIRLGVVLERKDAHEQSIMEKLLHDADCMDIYRCKGDAFNHHYLSVYKEADQEGKEKLDLIMKAMKQFIKITECANIKVELEGNSKNYREDLRSILRYYLEKHKDEPSCKALAEYAGCADAPELSAKRKRMVDFCEDYVNKNLKTMPNKLFRNEKPFLED